VRSILSKAQFGSQPGGRPPVAVELAPQGVLAASTPAAGKPPAFAFAPLAAGALLPGIGEPNLRSSEAVVAAIRGALGQVSARTRAVTLVLPDTAVRIFVLDFDTLPAKTAEVVSVLRFRLRKMIPFEVEHAGLSYQVLTQSKDNCKVLAAVLPAAILAEYEAAVRAAGYEPGAVLPTSLAALSVINSMEAVLTANLTSVALTTAITNGADLLLYRTLDLPEAPAIRQEEVQRGIAVAAAYFEDKLGAPPQKLYFAGSDETAEEFAAWLDAPELAVVELAARPEIGATTPMGNISIAGVVGALAGAN
jgi:type IV pilus assembly protein PilM